MKSTLDMADLKQVFSEISGHMSQNETRINEQDSVYGDGQLGQRMANGFGAIPQQLPEHHADGIGGLMEMAGGLLGKNAASPLGSILASGLSGFGSTAKGQQSLDLGGLINGLTGMIGAISQKGAQPGQKTILDSLIPALNALQNAKQQGVPMPQALQQAEVAAQQGVEASRDMQAQHGTAAKQGERTVGHPDPGATVGSLIMKGLSGIFQK